jgi:hypothetical protein
MVLRFNLVGEGVRSRGLSDPIFRPKPNTHHMCAQEQYFRTYGHKCSQ